MSHENPFNKQDEPKVEENKENIKINKIKVRPFSYYQTELNKKLNSEVVTLPKVIDDDSFVKFVQNAGFSLGNRTRVDIKFSNDQFCVLVLTESSHDFNASTKAYNLAVWKKGEGIAMGGPKETKAEIMPGQEYRRGVKGTTNQDLSNYLSTTVSIEDNKIKLEGKSEVGDVNVLEYYELS